MEASWSIADIASCSAVLIALITFFINRKDGRFKSIEEKMDNGFREMHSEFKEVRKEIGEVKERLAFVEAETIMYNITPDPLSRSEAAKKMWQRRRAKKLLKVEKKGE